jgi:hypothetical protein
MHVETFKVPFSAEYISSKPFTPLRGIRLLVRRACLSATHRLTGDCEHFEPRFREDIAGVLNRSPGQYPRMTADDRR